MNNIEVIRPQRKLKLEDLGPETTEVVPKQPTQLPRSVQEEMYRQVFEETIKKILANLLKNAKIDKPFDIEVFTIEKESKNKFIALNQNTEEIDYYKFEELVDHLFDNINKKYQNAMFKDYVEDNKEEMITATMKKKREVEESMFGPETTSAVKVRVIPKKKPAKVIPKKNPLAGSTLLRLAPRPAARKPAVRKPAAKKIAVGKPAVRKPKLELKVKKYQDEDYVDMFKNYQKNPAVC